MARARDPNRDKAFEIWKQSNGEIKLKDIADQLGISEGTVRGWKNKDQWDKQVKGTFQSKERNATERPKETERSKRIEERNVSPPEIENDDGPLTEKQRLFVLEYLRDFNATRAAMAIGYSKKTAYAIGWNLLRKVEIQAEIKRQKELRATELGLDVQRVIAEYMKIAFADITDLLEFGQKKEQILDEQGNPVLDPITGEPMTYKRNYVSFKNSDEIDGTVVGEVKQGKDGVSIKLHDKMKALEKLEKYVGFMTEEQRLKLEKTKLEVAHLRGEDELQEDDGFLDALDGKVEQIWDDEDE
ncbi:terminase small subunit [Brevibacillus borstelensis]|uniref:terminase small subunit n=1 Tax=Brevibacillus borstelensis TaxID=45462 RepID=UPI00287FBDE4|nr:terminase small subunit [Brevibacillus borstelensis]WNF07254.1 terminase small subunit [Brevibacillus borstelensis]